jgi:hypothetical protein
MSQMNPDHVTPPQFLEFHFNIILPCMPSLTSGHFPSGLPTNILYTLLIPLKSDTLPVHLILTSKLHQQ